MCCLCVLLCLVAFACAPKIDADNAAGHRRCVHVREATNEGIDFARGRVKKKVKGLVRIFGRAAPAIFEQASGMQRVA
jgi:hypothetical protein